MNSDYVFFEERVRATIGDMRQDFKITPARVPPGDLHSNASILVSSVVPRSKIDAILSVEAARTTQSPPLLDNLAQARIPPRVWIFNQISGACPWV
jgi:hypothetical protein